MSKILLELDDGLYVEAEATGTDELDLVSNKVGETIKKAGKSFQDLVSGTLTAIGRTVKNSMQELSDETTKLEANLEIGLKFNASGKIYIVNAESEANLKVKLTFKPNY